MHPGQLMGRIGSDHIDSLLLTITDHKTLNYLAVLKVKPVADLRLVLLHKSRGGYADASRTVLLPPSPLD